MIKHKILPFKLLVMGNLYFFWQPKELIHIHTYLFCFHVSCIISRWVQCYACIATCSFVLKTPLHFMTTIIISEKVKRGEIKVKWSYSIVISVYRKTTYALCMLWFPPGHHRRRRIFRLFLLFTFLFNDAVCCCCNRDECILVNTAPWRGYRQHQQQLPYTM